MREEADVDAVLKGFKKYRDKFYKLLEKEELSDEMLISVRKGIEDFGFGISLICMSCTATKKNIRIWKLLV